METKKASVNRSLTQPPISPKTSGTGTKIKMLNKATLQYPTIPRAVTRIGNFRVFRKDVSAFAAVHSAAGGSSSGCVASVSLFFA